MRYDRTFRFSACHFNDQKCYDILWQWHKTNEVPNEANILYMLKNTHGHNFKVRVDLEIDGLDENGFVVDDPELEAIVMAWSNKNLSLQPDFAGQRATTENMASILCEKISVMLGIDRVWSLEVDVHETEDIAATCTRRSMR